MVSDVVGYLVLFVACVFYGSYYVPARKYEIHDGLVFQWYQCSGIMLMGMMCAALKNDWWSDAPTSHGFYVAPEGVLSGVIFQLANLAATLSVKYFGLGLYFTTHQVTNLGGAFVVGVLGRDIGLPTTPPAHVGLAALGFCCVLVGMIPVMYMEKDAPDDGKASADRAPVTKKGYEKKATPKASAANGGAATPASSGTPGSKALEKAQAAGADEPLSPSHLQSLFQRDSTGGPSRLSADNFGSQKLRSPKIPSGTSRSRLADQSSRKVGEAGPSKSALHDFFAANAHTWDGSLGRPYLGRRRGHDASLGLFAGEGLIVSEEVEDDEADAAFTGKGDLEVPLLRAEQSGAATTAKTTSSVTRERAMARWFYGLFLSLIAGLFYSVVYVPLLVWQKRMKDAGHTVQGYDSFFSLCIGLYSFSSIYLLCVGAWKNYKGQRMEKSVLRPALLSGGFYAVACQAQLYAVMVLPYAVAYALGCGGALAVSLCWGTFYFGEAKTLHNRRCVVCSFTAVTIGLVLLGISAR